MDVNHENELNIARRKFVEAVLRGNIDLSKLTDKQVRDASIWCELNKSKGQSLLHAEWESRGETLRQAKAELERNLRRGMRCKCCGRNASIRRRTFNAPMAVSLVWLVRQSDAHTGKESHLVGRTTSLATSRHPSSIKQAQSLGWIRWAKEAPDAVHRQHEISRLVLFKVAERGTWNGDVDLDSGSYWYRPTELGRAFVVGSATIPRAVEVYNNKALGFDTERIDILIALKERFSLDVLLQASLSDIEKWDSIIKTSLHSGK